MNTTDPAVSPPVGILIAEDSPTQALHLRHILERRGYRVTHAANGRLALEAAQREKPTLIISDVVMPEMDGYELCRRVKADARLGDVPVILVTTMSDPGDVMRGLECRADNFILKPYEETHLMGRVQFLLLNRDVSQPDRATMGVEIFFNGQRHSITSDRLQILNLLLSTYDAAIQRTRELSRAQSEALGINQSLSEANRRLEQEIREREKADQALHRAHTELAQASRLKDEFLANMSHELRTPLNAILGLSEALLEDVAGTLTPRQVKSITTISHSGQHLLALINDILDLSKIEAGKFELNLDTVSVPEFCESCLVFVRTQAMYKHISVTFEPDARAARFTADPKRLRQILVNLLTNAVKFTPEGGRIGLTVSAVPGEDVLRFTVWDSGIGIAAADQKKLFRAFTQIDSGLARTQEGTGLGLALVAKLTELHGGGVTIESEPGQGSRFIVTLPLSARPWPTPAPEPAPPVEPDRRSYHRAMIIEDDPTSGTILMNYLTELGIDSMLHVQGEKSVEAALREQPDVVLLDILMPNENGWVVLAKLKEHPSTRDIPVVVVSVVDEPAKSRALGAAEHFTKPITREQLAAFFQRQAPPRAPRGSRPPFKAPGSGAVILLAEDNEANIETIGGYLEDKGYTLRYAPNGLIAVQLARELHPALILMDVQMPVMDGLTAMREIRADPTLKDIPIVALTALAMTGDRERCLEAGATDYLSKPVSLKALVALVERCLSPAESRK